MNDLTQAETEQVELTALGLAVAAAKALPALSDAALALLLAAIDLAVIDSDNAESFKEKIDWAINALETCPSYESLRPGLVAVFKQMLNIITEGMTKQ